MDPYSCLETDLSKIETICKLIAGRKAATMLTCTLDCEDLQGKLKSRYKQNVNGTCKYNKKFNNYSEVYNSIRVMTTINGSSMAMGTATLDDKIEALMSNAESLGAIVKKMGVASVRLTYDIDDAFTMESLIRSDKPKEQVLSERLFGNNLRVKSISFPLEKDNTLYLWTEDQTCISMPFGKKADTLHIVVQYSGKHGKDIANTIRSVENALEMAGGKQKSL